MYFVFNREFCNVFIFTSALIFFSKSNFRVYESILEISETKTAAKRENMQWTFLLFWLYVWRIAPVVEMGWKFSLVCALALYMLNQSKLYLGRHICLSICLWYRNNYHCGKCKFQWRCKTETTARPFLFWLQQFMDELLNDILRMRSRYSENYFKRHFECDQVQGMKLSEMWKAENRLNYWFCSCIVSLMRYIQLYYTDIQHIAYISYNIVQISNTR